MLFHRATLFVEMQILQIFMVALFLASNGMQLQAKRTICIHTIKFLTAIFKIKNFLSSKVERSPGSKCKIQPKCLLYNMFAITQARKYSMPALQPHVCTSMKANQETEQKSSVSTKHCLKALFILNRHTFQIRSI